MCVEVAVLEDRVFIRNSNDPNGDALTFARLAWTSFISGVRRGDFLPA